VPSLFEGQLPRGKGEVPVEIILCQIRRKIQKIERRNWTHICKLFWEWPLGHIQKYHFFEDMPTLVIAHLSHTKVPIDNQIFPQCKVPKIVNKMPLKIPPIFPQM